MSHYTLRSGIPTDTITFKCEGCERRLPIQEMWAADLITRHKWLVAVCSRECGQKADAIKTAMVLQRKESPLMQEALAQAGITGDIRDSFYVFLGLP